MKKVISNRQSFSVLTIIILVVLVGISVFSFRTLYKRDIGQYIVEDIAQLSTIFADIDQTAGIAGFDLQKNLINFLNIKKDGFIGSELGSMNLMKPKKWNGPYLEEMPKIQEEDYMVVHTQKGYFITPGDGVQLPNGKVIGRDILLNEAADIELMMHDDQMLSYNGKPLAAKITIGGQQPNAQPIILIEDIE